MAYNNSVDIDVVGVVDVVDVVDVDAHSSKVSFLALGGKLLLEAEACCFLACVQTLAVIEMMVLMM